MFPNNNISKCHFKHMSTETFLFTVVFFPQFQTDVFFPQLIAVCKVSIKLNVILFQRKLKAKAFKVLKNTSQNKNEFHHRVKNDFHTH